MGYRQHLLRSILAIREEGGVSTASGEVLWPEPLLVGRNGDKLRAIAERHDIQRWTASLDEALSDPTIDVYFDSQVTSAREPALIHAIEAGKHVYSEKPTATSLSAALHVARLARDHGVVDGVVQDKLFLPGLVKLRRLIDEGFFGRVLSIRGEFGYWVFPGNVQAAQRPSWNYRAEHGGGIVLDMFPHWRYILDHLFAPVRSVYATAPVHIATRWDENGQPYPATAEDAAYAILELEGGIVAQINSSWAVRVNRHELVEFQVDGTHGSAVAGLWHCRTQHNSTTPKPVWNPDVPEGHDFLADWALTPDNTAFDNGFKVQWQHYLRHVAEGTRTSHDLLDGARGVQLAELAMQSARDGRRVEVPELTL
jgi:predicted dehydrogenase